MKTIKAKLTIISILIWSCFQSCEATANQPFVDWLNEFKKYAMSQGISSNTLDSALTFFLPNETVIRLDRNQPEYKLKFSEYLAKIVDQKFIEQARTQYRENKALLEEISKEFSVQPEYIIALWGMESRFGKLTGKFNMFDALLTLAYDSRRSSFFKNELLDGLRIVDRYGLDPMQMKASWAGAMGQSQFMPSSYLAYAYDYDNDGKPDIWNNKSDIFASIANYLSSVGWRNDLPWGVKVTLPKDFDRRLIDLKAEKTVDEWKKLGVKMLGKQLYSSKNKSFKASIVALDMDSCMHTDKYTAYLVSGNYKTMMHWNRSVYFATTIGLIADKVISTD